MCASGSGHTDLVQLLLSSGAQVNLQDKVRHINYSRTLDKGHFWAKKTLVCCFQFTVFYFLFFIIFFLVIRGVPSLIFAQTQVSAPLGHFSNPQYLHEWGHLVNPDILHIRPQVSTLEVSTAVPWSLKVTPMGNKLKWLLKEVGGHTFESCDISFENTPTSHTPSYVCLQCFCHASFVMHLLMQ